MFKIAYCDDMEKDRNRIMYALSQIEENLIEEFEFVSFNSGEELCANLVNDS